MPTNKSRNIVWRALLRLMTVGTDETVTTDADKKECIERLNALGGDDLCPLDMDFSVYRNHFHAFADLLTTYTGKNVSEKDAYHMFSNLHNRGYNHTKLFFDTVGDMPWPPNNNGIRRPPLVQKNDVFVVTPTTTPMKRKRDPENTPLPLKNVEKLWDWAVVEREMFGDKNCET